MDDALRNALWDAIRLTVFHNVATVNFSRRTAYDPTVVLMFDVWNQYFKKPTDTIPTYWEDTEILIRKYFMECAWFDAYGLLEFLVRHSGNGEKLRNVAQGYMKREMAAYRFVNDSIVEITSESEIVSIETASVRSPKPVQTHLAAALEHLSNRTNPDYRNSVKESISAVEAMAQELTADDNAKSGQALKALPEPLPPALAKAFSAMYGYTSGANGIRHALSDESTVDAAEARFMLVTCSAFVNFVRERSGKSLS
jgi:hypothetical protein